MPPQRQGQGNHFANRWLRELVLHPSRSIPPSLVCAMSALCSEQVQRGTHAIRCHGQQATAVLPAQRARFCTLPAASEGLSIACCGRCCSSAAVAAGSQTHTTLWRSGTASNPRRHDDSRSQSSASSSQGSAGDWRANVGTSRTIRVWQAQKGR
jgi:hypothetical protein